MLRRLLAVSFASLLLATPVIAVDLGDDDDDLIVLGTPKVTLTAPPANSVYAAPATISLTASASAPAVPIQRVDYFQGVTLIGSATSAPYNVAWSSVPAGIYSLTARAKSTLGMSGTSAPVQVRVCGIPVTAITAPVGGTVVGTGSSVSLQASAASPAGACAITKVEFYGQTTGGPVLLGTSIGQGPYNVTWTATPSGVYTLTAVAYDERSVTATSAPVVVTVEPAPSVAITSPTNGAVFTPPATIAISATASDDGSIAKVDFYQGATLLCTDTTSPYTCSWTNAPAGSYVLTAKATDNQGLVTTSSPVNIAVDQPPAVSLTAPANNASFVAPANITLTATATDSDGTVSKVEFYQAATLLGTITTGGAGNSGSTYTFNWTNVPTATYSLTAKAYDNQGVITTSTPAVSVNVTPAGAPPAPTALKSFSPASIPTGGSSVLTITLNPKLIYVGNFDANTISVVNTATTTVLATVPGGTQPYYTAVSPSGNRVYIANYGANAVSVLDTSTNAIVATIPVGTTPVGIATHPTSNFAYVANNGSTTVSVINTASNTVATTISVGTHPINVLANAAGTRAYVTNFDSNSVSVIDASSNTLLATIPVGANPRGMAVNAAGTVLYVANSIGNTVSVINTTSNTVTATIPVGTYPIGVAVSPDASRVYTANYSSNTVSVINTATNTVVATVPVGINPGGVLVDLAGSKVYASNRGTPAAPGNALSVINTATNTVSSTIAVGNGPWLQTNSMVAPFASATTGVALTDNYPAGLVNAAAASPATTCGGTVTAANNGNTLTLSGATLPTTASCTVTVNVTAAAAGTFVNSSGPITTSNAGTGAATSGTLTATNRAPVVSIGVPASGAAFAAPANVAITATATDPDGTVSKVDFYQGATLIGTVTTGGSGNSGSNYSLTWNGALAGSYSLTAKATDNLSAVTTSSAVPVYVCGPPAVALTSPSAGQVFGAPASITLAATATTATGCGAIQRVEFYNGTTLVNSDAASPFSYLVTGLVAGSYTFKGRAYDGFNQFTDSTAVTVQVINDQPPTITSVTPLQTQIALGGTANFSVVASDPDAGDSVTVKLYRGGTLIATGTATGVANTYSLVYLPGSAVNGDTLTVVVTDTHNVTTQQNVVLTVIDVPTSATPNADALIPPTYLTPSVGTTAGTFAVGDSGAAEYSIPLQVPPGTAGMQPKLALNYSSQGGNGLLGVGWTLSGLSVITRCPKNPAQDGTRAGINYDNDATNDNYCLDGQRLVRTAGPFSYSDTNYSSSSPVIATKYEYRTELDTYAKIEGFEDTNAAAVVGAYRFRVWTKSGQVLDYGSRWWILSTGFTQGVGYNGSLQSRVNVAKVWVLDRVLDRSSNFMEIDYIDRAGDGRNVAHLLQNCGPPGPLAPIPTPIGAYPNVEYWPTAIRYYASGAYRSECGSSPSNQVRFTYEDVPSQATTATRDRYYDSGAGQTSLSKRLIRVDTSVDGMYPDPGTTAKSYLLSYISSQQTTRSLLQSITECGADGVCLPATQFEWAQKDWNTTGHNFAVSTVSLPFGVSPFSPSKNGVYVADWNGDGKSDLLGWNSTGPDINGVYTHQLVVCLATGTGFTCGQNAVSTAAFATYQDQSPVSYGSTAPIELMDFNNDGLVDIASYDSNGNWTVCLSNGSYTCTLATGTWKTATPNGPTFRGDFDGDGRIDVVTYLGNSLFETCLTRDPATNGGLGFSCSISNLDINSQTYQQTTYPGYSYTPCNIPVEGNSCEQFFDDDVQYQVLVADVNGDGKADLVRRSDSDTNHEKWKVCLSDFGIGRSNTYHCHDRFIQGAKGNVENTVVYDFNGDGIADMASTETGTQMRVCLSTGDGAFEFRDPGIHWSDTAQAFVDSNNNPIDYYNSTTTPRCRLWNAASPSDYTKAMYGDFNGDGRTDIASWNTVTNKWTVCLSTGSAFLCSDWSGPTLSGSGPDLNQWVVSGDFNGDGKTDIICLASTCNGQLGLSTGPLTGDVLTKITTGLSATTQITYAPLTDTTVYAKGSGALASQQELDIQSPMFVVKQTQASNGIGGQFTSVYFYEGLEGRTDGRGLYGFAKKRMRDDSNIVSETEYLRTGVTGANYVANWPIVGRPSIVRKYAPSPITYPADISQSSVFNGGMSLFSGQLRLVNRSTNNWTVRNSKTCGTSGFATCGGAPTVVEGLLSSTFDESWELDGTALPTMITATPSYDEYANPLHVTVTSSDSYIKDTVNTYASDVSNWLLGRLTDAVVTSTKPGESAVQRESSFTYNAIAGASCTGAAPGQLCDEIVEPQFQNDVATSYSLWQRTSYVYDVYGNRTTATVQFKENDGTLKSRATTAFFGYNGRFPTQVTNAKNQSETRQFDTRFGTVTQQTGPNGIVTRSFYDGFARKYGERVLDTGNHPMSEVYTTIDQSGLSGNEKYRVLTQISGGGESQVFYDQLQRDVRALAKAFNNGTYATATTSYDPLGRKASVVKPAGAGSVTTTPAYDALSRPISELTTGTGQSLTTQYAYTTFANGAIIVDGQAIGGGHKTTVTQSGTTIVARSTTKYVNSQGQSVRVTDGGGKNTDFRFDPYGNLAKTIGPTGIVETMGYDRRGRKTSLSNPDSGAWVYKYNGVGELGLQTDGKGQATRMYYDVLGRMIERREYMNVEGGSTPFVTVSSYDTYADGSACADGIGKLCGTWTATIVHGSVGGDYGAPETRTTTVYDQGGRATRGTTQVDGQSFVSITTFDANGRVDKLVYPSGFMVVHRYTAWSGQLDQVAEWTGGGTGTVHWQANSRYADGQVNAMLVGSQTTSKTYDGFGRLATVSTGAGTIQNAAYGFDALGNLTSRYDPSAGQASQTFGYDLLNRVTSDGVTSVIYDDAGNISSKGGTYGYVPGTHRLSSAVGNTYGSYDGNGNVGTISNGNGTRTLTYTAFNLPSSITGPSGSVAYLHDAAHARIREISSGASSSGLTYYLGGFEEHVRTDNVVEQRHYLRTPEGVIGIVTLRSNGQNDARYWHKDHIGSVAVITDAAGNVKEKFSYDAWGNRNVIVHAVTTGDPYDEERGYTGHEQLAEVGLTHMNGRIYDPVTGRFLQADPMIQDPFNGQNYNRYGYVLNNPLSIVDPTGFSWWTQWRRPIAAIVVAVVAWWAAPYVGAYFGAAAEQGTLAAGASEATAADAFSESAAAARAATVVAGGFASGGIQGGNIESAVQGALFAGLNFGIGDITSGVVGTGNFGNGAFAVNVGSHAALGCVQQASAGGNCKAGALSAGFSAFAGPLIDGRMPVKLMEQIVIGGLASRLGGDRFSNGAITAAFDYLFNCSLHPDACSPAEIKQKAASCGGSLQCARDVVLDAEEARLSIGPTMGGSLKSFADLTTLPTRILTPWGRAADLGIDVVSGAVSYYKGTSEWISTEAGAAYGMFIEWSLKTVNTELAGRAGAIAGKVWEAIVVDMVNGQKQNAQNNGKAK